MDLPFSNWQYRCYVERVIDPKSDLYDTKKVEELARLGWIPKKQREMVQDNKRELLELAKSGAKRPVRNSKLGRCLCVYTTSHRSYDAEFTNQIKELRPDWFTNIAKINKDALLELADSGAKRPERQSKLGRALGYYTNKTERHDAAFTNQIKELRPDWFVNTAQTKKDVLLELAKSGAKRPLARENLGIALDYYINNKTERHDAAFTNQIKELRPDWFVNTAQTKKDVLLELAKSGAKRPLARENLGIALGNYIYNNSKCRDEKFANQIKKIRPDWFGTCIDVKGRRRKPVKCTEGLTFPTGKAAADHYKIHHNTVLWSLTKNASVLALGKDVQFFYVYPRAYVRQK